MTRCGVIGVESGWSGYADLQLAGGMKLAVTSWLRIRIELTVGVAPWADRNGGTYAQYAGALTARLHVGVDYAP